MDRYEEALALIKAFLTRKSTIGQLRQFIREAEKRGEEMNAADFDLVGNNCHCTALAVHGDSDVNPETGQHDGNWRPCRFLELYQGGQRVHSLVGPFFDRRGLRAWLNSPAYHGKGCVGRKEGGRRK